MSCLRLPLSMEIVCHDVQKVNVSVGNAEIRAKMKNGRQNEKHATATEINEQQERFNCKSDTHFKDRPDFH